MAMDPARDIILAYMQNGEKLLPDHGFPVRMIIPGFIGGRMVKWLKRIIVTTRSRRIIITLKTTCVAVARGCRTRQLRRMVVQAGIHHQRAEYKLSDYDSLHEEILPINSWTTQRPYTLRGYAYSGETWNVCNLDVKEKGNKYGKFWCWCFWSLEVEVLDLLGAKEVAVRAWDQTLNTQPDKLIWNLM
ncbi:hypothetical protein OSB04_012139, partial [Centaurea solstitialis]